MLVFLGVGGADARGRDRVGTTGVDSTEAILSRGGRASKEARSRRAAGAAPAADTERRRLRRGAWRDWPSNRKLPMWFQLRIVERVRHGWPTLDGGAGK